MRWGGFPGIHQIAFSEQPWRQYLDAIHNTVVLRDVVSRFQVRNVRLLEDVHSFVLDNLERIDKYYTGDPGLRAARRPFSDASIPGLLENAVFLELRRRGHEVHVGRWGEQEIDFVAQRQGEVQYVQVAYRLGAESIVEREFGALERIRDSHPKLVLSMERTFPSRQGIRHAYLPEWLMGGAGA